MLSHISVLPVRQEQVCPDGDAPVAIRQARCRLALEMVHQLLSHHRYHHDSSGTGWHPEDLDEALELVNIELPREGGGIS
jgi:hypothetical protein